MRPLFAYVSRSILSVNRLILLWILSSDVTYAVLPVGVLALITGLLGAPFHDFWLIKEWAFASIIFFGVSIRTFIRLKVGIQETEYRLYAGVQLHIILLIAAVLVLSLVILMEKGVLPATVAPELGFTQIVLLCLVWRRRLSRSGQRTRSTG